jgi:hypothetical protein
MTSNPSPPQPPSGGFVFLETEMTNKNLMFPDLVSRLNASRREIYEERAGVREFDAGLPRACAECAALLDVAVMDALAFTGVSLLRVQQGPVNRFVLVADDREGRMPPTDAVNDLRSAVLWAGGVAELVPSEDLNLVS